MSSPLPTPEMRRRVNGVFAFIVAGAVYLSYNIFNTAIIKGEYYRGKANDQQFSAFTIRAERGTIYDKNGTPIATSKTVWTVTVSPSAIEGDTSYDTRRYNKELEKYNQKLEKNEPATPPLESTKYDQAAEIADALAEILGLDRDEIYKKCMQTDKKYVEIQKHVQNAQYQKIEQFKKDFSIGEYAVYNVRDTERVYPKSELAASVIGFTNADGYGAYGIEAKYDEYLRGVDGKEGMARSEKGEALPGEQGFNFPAKEGNDLYLTIDEVLQYYLEKNLDVAVTENNAANRATGIIMNAKTGAILAMATSPGYDLSDWNSLSPWYESRYESAKNKSLVSILTEKGIPAGNVDSLSETEREQFEKECAKLYKAELEFQWQNKCITDTYYPGSVFKTIVAASALEEQVVSVNSTFDCSGVVFFEGASPIHCWNLAGHGTLNLAGTLIKSCNPAFINIGQRLGKDKFFNYFEAFGFTEKTGIDLPGEVAGSYLTPDKMGIIELASSSFGQTNTVTPLQMITAFSATINGGYLLTPYVVDKICDKDGNIIYSGGKNVKRQVISEETSAIMRELLETVVSENGGSNAYIPGYRIGGKSGTTQKIDIYNKTGEMEYIGTFCAFTPADNPEIVCLICVDEPDKTQQYYGSKVAAPVVSEVFQEMFDYLKMAPFEKVEDTETIVPYVTGQFATSAKSQLTASGLKSRIVGSESGTVIATVPPSGYTIGNGGTVVVYTSGGADDPPKKVMGVVPDVTNMTVTEASAVMAEAGFNIRLSGGAVKNAKARATSQDINPNEEIPIGTVITVTFLVQEETE